MGLLRPTKWVNWCEDLDRLQKECDKLRAIRHSLPKKSKEWWTINKQLSDKISEYRFLKKEQI